MHILLCPKSDTDYTAETQAIFWNMFCLQDVLSVAVICKLFFMNEIGINVYKNMYKPIVGDDDIIKDYCILYTVYFK